MAFKSLGVIGSGAIAAPMLEAVARNMPKPMERLSLLTLPAVVDGARALVERCGPRIAKHAEVFTDADAFLAQRYDLVVECAGHAAVKAYGAKVLATGTDLLVVSIGALTDDTLRDRPASSGRRIRRASDPVLGRDRRHRPVVGGIASPASRASPTPRASRRRRGAARPPRS